MKNLFIGLLLITTSITSFAASQGCKEDISALEISAASLGRADVINEKNYPGH